jgi:hypothetical protein
MILRRLKLFLPGTAVCLLLLTAAGCEVVGAPFAAFDSEEGPQPVAAQYTGLQDQRVAVLVQVGELTRYRFPEATRAIANAMTLSIAQQVPGVTVTPTSRTLAYQAEHPLWSAIPASRVIRALDVDRLVIVDVAEYRTQEPGNQHLWRGVIDALVAVHEADDEDPDNKSFEQRVRAEWPEGTAVGLTTGDDATMQAAALTTFTRRASGLFHDYEE